MRSTILILLIYFLSITSSKSQEMLGLVNGNYSGTSGVLINPSSFTDSKLYLDVNIITAAAFFQNNYLYVAKRDYYFFYFFNSPMRFPKHENNKVLYSNYPGALKHGYLNLRANGPGMMINIGRHAFGFHEGFRAALSVRDAPYHLSKFLWDGLDFKQQQDINYNVSNMRIAGMAWAEVGLTYSYVLFDRKMYHFSVGATAKRLMSVGGMYITNHSMDYSVPSNDSMVINNIDAEMGYAMNGGSTFKGTGWGGDFGVTLKIKPRGNPPISFRKLCQQKYNDYSVKIGLSLLDFGIIRFKKGASVNTFENLSSTWTNVDSLQIRDYIKFRDQMNLHFFNSADPDISKTKDKFSISLPTAISLQADIHLQKHWYLNSTFFYGLQSSKTYVRRPAQLSFTPRWESKFLELNIPVSLYEMRYPRLGASLRIGGLTVGTDKLAGYFDFNDFYGLDFYASLKFFLSKGSCSQRNWSIFKSLRTKIFKCRTF
ncbi:MAG: DUF5723 family protein [Bacteroidota bacterium]